MALIIHVLVPNSMKFPISFFFTFLLIIIVSENSFAETSKPNKNYANEPLTLIWVNTLNLNSQSRFQILQNYDIINSNSERIELVVNDKELKKLKKAGLQIQEIRKGAPLKEKFKISGTKSLPIGYLSLEQILEQMQEVVQAYPNIAQLIDVTSTYDMPTTFEGRHMFILKISDNVDQEEDEPDLLIVSNHHAREVVTPVIALYAIDQFVTHYGTDPEITAMVDNHEIWIAPTWNPDGYNYMYNFDDMWRKNRRVGESGIGVDQNRNYPHLWDSDHSGSTDMSSNIYKGPSAGSEPETQTMIALSEDQRFEKVMDFHSSGRQVLWGYYNPTHPFDAYLQSEALNLAMNSGYYGINNTKRPSANGEHYQWQLGKNGSQAFLIETHTKFGPSYESAQEEAAQVWQGIKWNLKRKIPISGHITDSITGDPIEAKIGFKGIYFPYNESNFSDKHFGYYHQFCPPGTFTLSFSAEGYATVEKEIMILEDSAQTLAIKLSPIITAIDEPLIKDNSKGVELFLNYPNPAHSGTNLSYNLPNAGHLLLEIYNTNGALVKKLVEEYQTPGKHHLFWNLEDFSGQKVSNGIYISRLTFTDKNRSLSKQGKILVQH